MATLRYTERAIADIRELVSFLLVSDPAGALATTGLIDDGLQILKRHPLMGRPAGEGLRQLPISRGHTGYLASYEYVDVADEIRVIAIRHQREAGFDD